MSLTAHTCLLTECFFICLWDIRIYIEPEVTFNCTVTQQSGAQLWLLKSTGLVYWRTVQRKLLIFCDKWKTWCWKCPCKRYFFVAENVAVEQFALKSYICFLFIIIFFSFFFHQGCNLNFFQDGFFWVLLKILNNKNVEFFSF